MRQATERLPVTPLPVAPLPVTQAGTEPKIADKPVATAQAGSVKPTTGKPGWIEHRDWHGEGVVGESHTD
jgi:hypothetical protein